MGAFFVSYSGLGRKPIPTICRLLSEHQIDWQRKNPTAIAIRLFCSLSPGFRLSEAKAYCTLKSWPRAAMARHTKTAPCESEERFFLLTGKLIKAISDWSPQPNWAHSSTSSFRWIRRPIESPEQIKATRLVALT